MALILFSCRGGAIALPARGSALVGREDGGNLVVHPPRPVWERSELEADELAAWSFLVAAAGRAMIDALPQLANGCVNYWEAGNWALNDAAEPVGRKSAEQHRSVHMHLLGRSPGAADPSWTWGEAPVFPRFAGRREWASNHERLSADECARIVARARVLWTDRYGMPDGDAPPTKPCPACGYPTPAEHDARDRESGECRRSGSL
ncbi:MAG: hypothetical protein ABI682_04490 [Acidobacteriota bacterium]